VKLLVELRLLFVPLRARDLRLLLTKLKIRYYEFRVVTCWVGNVIRPQVSSLAYLAGQHIEGGALIVTGAYADW